MRRCRDLVEWLVLAWRQHRTVVAQMSQKDIAQINEASHELSRTPQSSRMGATKRGSGVIPSGYQRDYFQGTSQGVFARKLGRGHKQPRLDRDHTTSG